MEASRKARWAGEAGTQAPVSAEGESGEGDGVQAPMGVGSGDSSADSSGGSGADPQKVRITTDLGVERVSGERWRRASRGHVGIEKLHTYLLSMTNNVENPSMDKVKSLGCGRALVRREEPSQQQQREKGDMRHKAQRYGP
jgi:hypothetical protein